MSDHPHTPAADSPTRQALPGGAHNWSISFVVLALNEADHIESTVQTVLEAARACPLADFQLVLVNDGSTDETGAIMERLAHDHPQITVVHNEHNLGLGGAYKSGLRQARCDYVMIVAGDNAMPSSDMSRILRRLGEADIILPYLANPRLRPLGRRIGSRAFTLVVNTLFGFRVRYYQGMLPRRSLVNQITINTDSYAFPAEVVVKLLKAGSTFVEVDIHETPANAGSSVALQPGRVWAVFGAIRTLVREVRRPGAIPSLTHETT